MGKVHALITQQYAEAEKSQTETQETSSDKEATQGSETGLGRESGTVDNSQGSETPQGLDLPPGIPAATPEPEPDAAGETVEAVVPSQLDSLSNNEEGPPSRLEFQSLMARVVLLEGWIKRFGQKI